MQMYKNIPSFTNLPSFNVQLSVVFSCCSFTNFNYKITFHLIYIIYMLENNYLYHQIGPTKH